MTAVRASFAALLVAIVLAAASGCLDEGEDLSFSADLAPAEQQLYRVDGDRKVYGTTRFTGTTVFDGQEAEVELLGHVSYIEGDGPFSGFLTLTFLDGSTLAIRHSGEADADASTANASFRGRLTVIGGTGRYEGVRGTGRMEGERPAELGGAVRMNFELEIRARD